MIYSQLIKGDVLNTNNFQQDGASKHQVYMVSSNDKYLSGLSNALSPFYHARTFNNTDELFDELFKSLPKTLIIDATLTGTSALRFITALRINFSGDQLPIIFTVMSAQESWINEANKISGLKCLERPFQIDQLLRTVTQQVNAHTEAQWDNIEPIQRQALQQTLAFYNSIAEKVMNGEIFEFQEVTDSCNSLIEAVDNKNYHDILRALREHDDYTYVHSMRAATFLCAFGQAVGFKGDELNTLTTGGLLLDVGKTYIPYALLNKKDPLDDKEYQIIKKHVEYGIRFLNNVKDLPAGVAIIAAQHHEKIDGTGYPHGIEGLEFDKLARMSAIVDVFCAMTDHRIYKTAFSPEKTLANMASMEGHLDRRLLLKFGEMLLDAPILHLN